MDKLFHLFFNIFLFSFPVVIAGILHMFVVKYDFLSVLKRPLHTLYFGKNKTWRGIILMPFFGIIGMFILYHFLVFLNLDEILFYKIIYKNFEPQTVNILLGFLLGLFYSLFELPNSYLKRKCGIAPGEQSKKFRLLFIILDRIDSSIGIVIIYIFWGFSPKECVLLIPLGILVHLMVTLPLYFFGIKEKAL